MQHGIFRPPLWLLSFSGGSSVTVSTAVLQGTHSSSFFQGSFSGDSQRQEVPPQPFHLFSSRVETPIPTPKKFCCVISETWILPILVLLAVMVYAVIALAFYYQDD